MFDEDLHVLEKMGLAALTVPHLMKNKYMKSCQLVSSGNIEPLVW